MQSKTVLLTAVAFLFLIAAVLAAARTPIDEAYSQPKTGEANVDVKSRSRINPDVCKTLAVQACTPFHFSPKSQRKSSASNPGRVNSFVYPSSFGADSGYRSVSTSLWSPPAETRQFVSGERSTALPIRVSIPQLDFNVGEEPLGFSNVPPKLDERPASWIQENLTSVSHPVPLLLFGLGLTVAGGALRRRMRLVGRNLSHNVPRA